MKQRNAVFMASFIGKTILSVEDTDSGRWEDEDGFILNFDDHSSVEVSAGMGQGMGFVIVSDPDKIEEDNYV